MKRYVYWFLFLGLAFALIVNTHAFAAGALYDNFSGTYIDGLKWNEREFVREVVGGKLVSKVGNAATDANPPNRTSFQNPSSINVIQSDIIVVATNLDSGINPASFARIDGRFYNTANSGTHRGDVYAGVTIGDRGNGLEAWWYVGEALDDEGSSWGDLGTGTLIVPGLAYGNSYTTKIEYNGANGFTFTVAGVSDSFTGPARLAAAFQAYKGLITRIFSDGGLGTGYVSALFDNVFINNQGTVYDDFSTAPLDQTKWYQDEEAREIANGKLRLNRLGFDGQSQTTLRLAVDDTPYLEAKVRIESSSQLSPGALGIARIQGYYYNESRGPGSGQDYNEYEDDVFVQIRLQLEDNGNLKAVAMVDRSEDANETTYTSLFSQDFTTNINFDTDYTLSIEFRESMLIFKCNDETLSYEITTPMYTPFGEHRALRSRVYLDPGESGYIKAQFDDVYVEQATYNASGDWDVSTSNAWVEPQPECGEPGEDDTSTVTITQNGNNVTLVVHTDTGDQTYNGFVSGDTYYFAESFLTPGGTETINITFTLSSVTAGTGQVIFSVTDGIITCSGGFDIAFTKQAGQPVVPVGGGGSSGCFIATAAYGSLMEPHVKILRDFRDHFLLHNSLGKGFVRIYYTYSPPMADFIAKHDSLRAMVRISLLPVVGVSWITLKIGSVSTMVLMLLLVSGFIGLVWFRQRYKE
jgi:hypothetical protein